MADSSDGVTWRELADEGCAFGKSLRRDVTRMERSMEDVKHKVDRLTWALAGAAITFGTAAIMLAANLLW